MGVVEVRPVRFPDDARAFVGAWWNVYRGDPCWVPPLISEQVRFLDPRRNPYFKVATIQPFVAYQDGVAVGTIAATEDHWMRVHEPGVGFFGFFEFVVFWFECEQQCSPSFNDFKSGNECITH